MYALRLPIDAFLKSAQLGAPLQIIDLGETAIDEETFDDYLHDIRQHYTAEKVTTRRSFTIQCH